MKRQGEKSNSKNSYGLGGMCTHTNLTFFLLLIALNARPSGREIPVSFKLFAGVFKLWDAEDILAGQVWQRTRYSLSLPLPYMEICTQITGIPIA